MDRPRPLLRRIAARLLPLALAAACGCGLFAKAEPIGFRTYTLEGVGYDEAASIVNDVTRELATQLFGGVTLVWDEELGNLSLDPVYDGQRRLSLYIHLAPVGEDVDVEMFALVEQLRVDATQVGYGEPLQDVPLEEKLFKAFVAELSRRRDEGG
jgi:hypothetical protein